MKRFLIILLCSLLILAPFSSLTPVLATDRQVEAQSADEAMIQNTIRSVFIAKRNLIASPAMLPFNPSAYTTGPVEYNESLCYFTRYVWLMKGNFADYDSYALNPRLQLEFRSIKIDSDTAVAEVYENLTFVGYSPKSGLDPRSSSIGMAYTISLQKQDDRWLIDNITFYDEVTNPYMYPLSKFSIPLTTIWTWKKV